MIEKENQKTVGKHINHGQKCPNCKKFGLKPFHKDPSLYYQGDKDGFSNGGINFYRCLNCFAEFEVKND